MNTIVSVQLKICSIHWSYYNGLGGEEKKERGQYKKTSREINREELKRYLSERGKISHIFDLLDKIDDPTIDMDAIDLQRKKYQ